MDNLNHSHFDIRHFEWMNVITTQVDMSYKSWRAQPIWALVEPTERSCPSPPPPYQNSRVITSGAYDLVDSKVLLTLNTCKDTLKKTKYGMWISRPARTTTEMWHVNKTKPWSSSLRGKWKVWLLENSGPLCQSSAVDFRAWSLSSDHLASNWLSSFSHFIQTPFWDLISLYFSLWIRCCVYV